VITKTPTPSSVAGRIRRMERAGAGVWATLGPRVAEGRRRPRSAFPGRGRAEGREHGGLRAPVQAAVKRAVAEEGGRVTRLGQHPQHLLGRWARLTDPAHLRHDEPGALRLLLHGRDRAEEVVGRGAGAEPQAQTRADDWPRGGRERPPG